MVDINREHELEAIIVDLCDGEREWYEIQERTGLSDERAKEVAATVDEVFRKYFARNLQA